MTPEVSLDNAIILRMLHNVRFTSAFPFLRTAALQIGARRGCGCGGRKSRPASRDPDYDVLRRSFANLPPERKVALKRLLNAEKVRIRYPRAEGGEAVLVF